jgi:DUF4097 and DUF4098 domain-containing protein YvlB
MKLFARAAHVLAVPGIVLSTTACDIVTADLRHQSTAEWRKTYELQPGGRVEVANVNGRIHVEPGDGNRVEIVAEKRARGATEEAAKQALERIEIREDVSGSTIKVETKVASGGLNMGGSPEVNYTLHVPASAEIRVSSVNGGIEVTGLSGRVRAETTNGGITARDLSGAVDATTTNGGVDIDVARLESSVSLGTTNGGIKLRLPADARATITASVANGGIDTSGLQLNSTTSSRRRLEGTLNGGGASVRLEGTNGGIRISAR